MSLNISRIPWQQQISNLVVPTNSDVAPVEGRVAPVNIEFTSSGECNNKTSSIPSLGSDVSLGAGTGLLGSDSIIVLGSISW